MNAEIVIWFSFSCLTSYLLGRGTLCARWWRGWNDGWERGFDSGKKYGPGWSDGQRAHDRYDAIHNAEEANAPQAD